MRGSLGAGGIVWRRTAHPFCILRQYPQSTPPANYGVPQSYAAPQNYGVPQNYAATQNYTATQNYAATQNAGTNVSADPQLAGQTDEQLAAEARLFMQQGRTAPAQRIYLELQRRSIIRASALTQTPSPTFNHQPPAGFAPYGSAQPTVADVHSRAGTKPLPVTRRINGRLRRPSSRPANSRPPSSRINRLRNSRRGLKPHPRSRAGHSRAQTGSPCRTRSRLPIHRNSQHTDSRQRKLFAAVLAVAGGRADAKHRIPAEPGTGSDGLDRCRTAGDGSRSAARNLSDNGPGHRHRRG